MLQSVQLTADSSILLSFIFWRVELHLDVWPLDDIAGRVDASYGSVQCARVGLSGGLWAATEGA